MARQKQLQVRHASETYRDKVQMAHCKCWEKTELKSSSLGVADSLHPRSKKRIKRGRRRRVLRARSSAVLGSSVRERGGEGGRWDIKPRSLMADRERRLAVPTTAAWRSSARKPPSSISPTHTTWSRHKTDDRLAKGTRLRRSLGLNFE